MVGDLAESGSSTCAAACGLVGVCAGETARKSFTDAQRAVFRARGEHRFSIPDGSRWGDVKATATNIGAVLTRAMRAVADSK